MLLTAEGWNRIFSIDRCYLLLGIEFILKFVFFEKNPKYQIKKSCVFKDKQDEELLYPFGDAKMGLAIFDINLGLT